MYWDIKTLVPEAGISCRDKLLHCTVFCDIEMQVIIITSLALNSWCMKTHVDIVKFSSGQFYHNMVNCLQNIYTHQGWPERLRYKCLLCIQTMIYIISLLLPHGMQSSVVKWTKSRPDSITVETLYSTIYYSKYFIELNIDKSTQYVALWTHKRHPIPRPFGRAMECLLWVLQQKLIVL